MRVSIARKAPGPKVFSGMSDRDLAARYWAARGELDRLRAPRPVEGADRSAEELAGAFQRIRELDALCAQLWEESQRRTVAGSIEANA